MLMAPVIVHSIGADDTYWILVSGPAFNGSVLEGVLAELARTGDTAASQPRFAQATAGLRRGLAIAILEMAIRLGIEPAAIWSVMRVAFFALSLVVVVWFLSKLRWHSKDGEQQALSRTSLIWIALGLPLVTAMGATTQIVSSINSWLDYAPITYPAIAFIFGTAGIVLVVYEYIERHQRAWSTALAVFALAGLAVLVNNSYETYWLAVPLAAVALFARVWRRPSSPRSRRALTLTSVGFFGVFVVNLAVYRSLVSLWNCGEEECYPGTQVSLSRPNLIAIAKNLIGSLPLVHRPLAQADAASVGVASLPWLTTTGVFAALLAVGAYVALALLVKRTPRIDGEVSHVVRSDRSVLIVIVIASAGVALGAALITGINGRAPALIADTFMPYRTGYISWFAMSLGILALVRLAVVSLRPRAALYLSTVLLVLSTVVLAISYPQNEISARANSVEPRNEVVDRVHREVALGDLTESGDARRCQALADFLEERGEGSYAARTIIGADSAFRFYYGAPFCISAGRLEGNTLVDWTG